LLTLTLVFPPWVLAPIAEAAFNDETTTRLPAATDDAYGFAVADVDGVNGPDILLAGRGRIDSLLMTAAATSRMRPTRACRVTRR